MVVILHNIRSLHNVGSIFRTADAVGAQKLYLGGITPAPVDRLGQIRQPLAKVSLGAERTVEWEKVTNIQSLIKRLKSQWFHVYAIEQARTSTPYYALCITRHELKRVALILGAEVEGLPPTILNKCDKILEIPMTGKKESLNVAVAFGIVAFWLRDGAKISAKPQLRKSLSNGRSVKQLSIFRPPK